MNASVLFRNFERLDHIHDFVLDSFQSSLGKFSRRNAFNAQIILDLIPSKSQPHNHLFQCEILIRSKRLNKTVVVKKESSDFYQALRSCFKVSEEILRRKSKMREKVRQNSGIRMIEQNLPLINPLKGGHNEK